MNPLVHSEKKKKKIKKEPVDDLGEIQASNTFQIASSEKVAKLETSQWPLLLKNFDRMNIRTNHYTPMPFGTSPYVFRGYHPHIFYFIYIAGFLVTLKNTLNQVT